MVTEEPSTVYDYQKLVNRVYHHSNFEFVGIALQAEMYPYPIKWCFVAGNRNERFRKITLRRGFGIAGLVLRTGKPFYSNDLPKYTLSSAIYTPIAGAEALTAAAAIPLSSSTMGVVTGGLLAGYRDGKRQVNQESVKQLQGFIH